MNEIKRPVPVTVVALVYLAIGAIGFVYHFPHSAGAFHHEDLWIELTEVLAIVAGAFLLRGKDWARWLALAWIAFHVLLSIPDYSKLAIHCLFLAAIAWSLLHRAAARYFRSAQIDAR